MCLTWSTKIISSETPGNQKASPKTSPLSDQTTSSWRHSSHNSEQNCEGEFLHLIESFFGITHSQSPVGVDCVRVCVVLCASLERADNRHTHSIHRLLGRTCGREGCDPCRRPRLPKKSLVFFVSHRQWAFLGYSPNIGHFWNYDQSLGIFGTHGQTLGHFWNYPFSRSPPSCSSCKRSS